MSAVRHWKRAILKRFYDVTGSTTRFVRCVESLTVVYWHWHPVGEHIGSLAAFQVMSISCRLFIVIDVLRLLSLIHTSTLRLHTARVTANEYSWRRLLTTLASRYSHFVPWPHVQYWQQHQGRPRENAVTKCNAVVQVINAFLFALRAECNRESEGHVYVMPSYLAVLWDRGDCDRWTFSSVCILLSVFC